MLLAIDTATRMAGLALYDEAQASNLEAYLAHFKGVVIESTDPLVITTYDDLWYLDAEWMPSAWWPNYGYGPGAWHNIAVGVRAEISGTLAFTSDKAQVKEVEWMSYIAGPSLEILKERQPARKPVKKIIPYVVLVSLVLSAGLLFVEAEPKVKAKITFD